MDNTLFKSYIINERSQVAFVKREIHNLVKLILGDAKTAQVDIIIAEICSNIIKHAGNGELLYRVGSENGYPTFEIISIDNGPGMKDVLHSSKDGISSKNTLGQGLGSIFRLSSFSQVYSLPGWGTILYSKMMARTNKMKPDKLLVRCIAVAKPGETVSGDAVSVRHMDDKVMIFAGDGLGHGEHAKTAVDKAILAFNQTMSADPSAVMVELHEGAKKTRGLVGTVALADFYNKKWLLCGVGNVMTRLQKGLEYRNYICNNGIISLNMPARLENAMWEMEKFQMLLFCSDGIKTRWDLVRYPSILKYDPIIIAAAIYKDYRRGTDDMTILIAKIL